MLAYHLTPYLTYLCDSSVIQEKLQKEFFETTLPARLEKFSALLKGRNEGKGYFFGDKVMVTKCVKRNVKFICYQLLGSYCCPYAMNWVLKRRDECDENGIFTS